MQEDKDKQTDDVVEEHFQKHSIEEVLHFPDHEPRETTAMFRESKERLEKKDHHACFVCGATQKLESHHMFERAFWNALDVEKVGRLLYEHFDFHGYCHQDFADAQALVTYLQGLDGDDQPDVLYNQLILCEHCHRKEGEGIHMITTPTFFAVLGAKNHYDIVMSEDEYEKFTRESRTTVISPKLG